MQSAEEVATVAFEATVTVLSFDGAGRVLGHGSGFTIRKSVVLTKAHVNNNAASLMVCRVEAHDALDVTRVPLIDEKFDVAAPWTSRQHSPIANCVHTCCDKLSQPRTTSRQSPREWPAAP